MSSRARWAVVAAMVLGLVAVPLVRGSWPVASAGLSPAAVVAAAESSASVAHEGLVEVRSTFGLPELPVAGQQASLLDSTSTMRTWWASPGSWRVDRLLRGGQTTTFVSTAGGSPAVRQWDFESASVLDAPAQVALRLPRADDLLPPQLARRLLGWVEAGDPISALPARRVAGSDAAGARVVPADPASTVDHVDLWVDPGSGLPVQVQVFAGDAAQPAVDSRFLDLSLGVPGAEVLEPAIAGTPVKVTDTSDLLSRISSRNPQELPASLGGLPRTDEAAGFAVPGVATYGSGFARITAVVLPRRVTNQVFDALDATAQALGVPSGRGRLVTSPLLSLAVVQGVGARRGVAVVGTVTPQALEAAVAALLAAS